MENSTILNKILKTNSKDWKITEEESLCLQIDIGIKFSFSPNPRDRIILLTYAREGYLYYEFFESPSKRTVCLEILTECKKLYFFYERMYFKLLSQIKIKETLEYEKNNKIIKK